MEKQLKLSYKKDILEFRLKGKKTLITAAGQGIGRSTALAFSKEGADVIDTELGYTGSGSGGGKWYVVPGTRDQFGSTLLFNPQTGEFNREWGGTFNDFEDLPPRYSDALHSAFQKQEDSFLPTLGTYF